MDYTQAEIAVQLQDLTLSAWTDGKLIIPKPLLQQTNPWLPFLHSFQNIIKDRVLVTSVSTSIDGSRRSGTSHPHGWAIDFTLPDRLAKKTNPHFENDLYLLTYLAAISSGPIMMVAESDHFHCEVSPILAGVFRYPTQRAGYYINDIVRNPRTTPDNQLWLVQPTKIELISDQTALIKQRQITERVLSSDKLTEFLSKVNFIK